MSSQDAHQGTLIAGRYRLGALLGRGGNGEVWRARDVVLDEDVAVKRLTRRAHATHQARVHREIAALRLLRLPGVVRLLDEGTDDQTPFLVMEIVDGAPFPGPAPSDSAPSPDSAPLTPASNPAAPLTPAPIHSAHVTQLDSEVDSPELILTLPDSDIAPLPDRPDVAPRARRPLAHPTAPVWTWPQIESTAIELLDILTRVHAAGIVHRDLKPANVLVRADGRPVLLDFGLSCGPTLGDPVTQTGSIVGTPAYLAPEQLRGVEATPAADLYAVGAMLYETLTGHLPHQQGSLQAMLLARASLPPTPVLDLAPATPTWVAQLVDQLLAPEPDHRPGSVADALAVLRDRAPRTRQPALPLLGGDATTATIATVVDRALAGRSVTITGPPGIGRSRCLREATARLHREGRDIYWAHPTARPLGSLREIAPAPDDPRASLADITARVDRALAQRLADGAILAVDDADRLDRWSAAVLRRQRTGAILRVVPARDAPPDALAIQPLSPEALEDLFLGPARLSHVVEDAAHLLWRRTQGVPARVAAEVAEWLRAGFAQRDGDRLTITREEIERLASAPPALRLLPHTVLGDAPPLQELLAWLILAGEVAADTAEQAEPAEQAERPIPIARLAHIFGAPRWRIEADLDELCRRGAAARTARGDIIPTGHTGWHWPDDARHRAHRALADAVPPATRARLYHLLAGDAPAADIAD